MNFSARSRSERGRRPAGAQRGTRLLAAAVLVLAYTAPAPAEDPWEAAGVAPEQGGRAVLRRTGPSAQQNSSAQRTPSLSPGWWRSTLALGGVVGGVLVLAWVVRRLPTPYRVMRPGLVQILSRTPINARQSLCLVRVGQRIVLVGVSPGQLATLDSIDDPAAVARLAAHGLGATKPAAFEQELGAQSGRFDDRANSTPHNSPPPAKIVNVRAKLAETIQRLRSRRSA
ncbi:MAG: hypothetical protein CHACPFDD_00996 [Phycisphaerae bacterium]|nr:hypothetical protein [Phycisphaerae bacterium]